MCTPGVFDYKVVQQIGGFWKAADADTQMPNEKGFVTLDSLRALNQFTYDYVKLKIGYFSNRIPVWEGIFTLENLT